MRLWDHVSMCLPACVRACMRACVRACVHSCVRACVRASVLVCVCVCVRVHMCTCERVCVCMWVSLYVFITPGEWIPSETVWSPDYTEYKMRTKHQEQDQDLRSPKHGLYILPQIHEPCTRLCQCRQSWSCMDFPTPRINAIEE